MTKKSNLQLRAKIQSALKHNKDGSFKTQADRRSILLKICDDLKECGHNRVTAQNIGAKHFHILYNHWQEKGLAIATIKNKFAPLRWFGEKIGKTSLPTNKDLQIPNRKYVDNDDQKAQEIDYDKLNKLDERYQLPILLQRYFGLRLEESLKFMVKFAHKGGYIALKDTWCKGGKARTIPVLKDSQRAILDRIYIFCRENHYKSMIPKELNYEQGENHFRYITAQVGIDKFHCYRHQYAQDRYKELTGWDCPKAENGISRKELSDYQRIKDKEARLLISKELGHERISITNVYLGS